MVDHFSLMLLYKSQHSGLILAHALHIASLYHSKSVSYQTPTDEAIFA